MPKSYLSNKSIEEIVLSRGKVSADHIKKKYKIGSARLNKLWENADLETISWITNAKQLASGGDNFNKINKLSKSSKKRKKNKRVFNELKDLKEIKNNNNNKEYIIF